MLISNRLAIKSFASSFKFQSQRYSLNLATVRKEDVISDAKQTSRNSELVRDYIHDSLYNPDYGYFSKRAMIFTTPSTIEFNKLQDNDEFYDLLAGWYRKFDEMHDQSAAQIWHTPTEIFRPHYGQSIAKYIVNKFKQEQQTEEPLVLYEMGAGNGTLMRDVLNYLKIREPQIYHRTQYNIIEISQQLAEKQKRNAEIHSHKNVNIINQSIFEWQKLEKRQCFFIALEVIDNFAHDLIKFKLTNNDNELQAQSAKVYFDKDTDTYSHYFSPANDEAIQRYLEYDRRLGISYRRSLSQKLKHRLIQRLFPQNDLYSDLIWIPTMQMKFIENLFTYFPHHNLILSDFCNLDSKIPGLNAPQAQTRQNFRMIQCQTYLLTKGWFDIFFPTDFDRLQKFYCLVARDKTLKQANAKIESHREFFEKYADLQQCRTKSGEIPLLDYYQNVKMFLT